MFHARWAPLILVVAMGKPPRPPRAKRKVSPLRYSSTLGAVPLEPSAENIYSQHERLALKIGLAMHEVASIACSIEEAQLFNGGSLAVFLTIIHADPHTVLDDHAMDLVNTADCQLMTPLAKLDFVAVPPADRPRPFVSNPVYMHTCQKNCAYARAALDLPQP